MKSFFSLAIGLLFIVNVLGQIPVYNKDYLQKQNAALKEEISKLNKKLQESRSQSKNSLVYVKNLNNKILRQEKLVGNLTKEKRFIEDEIYALGKEINALSKELNALKGQYKNVLITAYKNKSSQSKLLFVLSSKSLTQAYRRVKYLEKYSAYQLAKVKEITKKQTKIQSRQKKRKAARKEKNLLLAKQISFQDELEGEKLEKQKIVAEFKKNEGQITRQIREKRKRQKEVDREIQQIIEEEIRLAKIKEEEERKKREKEEAERKRQLEIAKKKALEEERKRQEELAKQREKEEKERFAKLEKERLERERKQLEEAAKIQDEEERERQKGLARQKAENEKLRLAKLEEDRKKEDERKRKEAEKALIKKVEDNQPKFVERKSNAALSKDFALNRGKLPWPVSRGTIVSEFGVHPHPVLSGIQIENSGVDIETSKGAFAKAVFDGVVSAVSIIPGGNKTVLVKHGNYFTVYHNLNVVSVKKGEKVNRNQRLGRIYTDEKNQTIMNFQVWKSTKKENPSLWIGGM